MLKLTEDYMDQNEISFRVIRPVWTLTFFIKNANQYLIERG